VTTSRTVKFAVGRLNFTCWMTAGVVLRLLSAPKMIRLRYIPQNGYGTCVSSWGSTAAVAAYFFALPLFTLLAIPAKGDSTMAAMEEIQTEVLVKSSAMWNGTLLPAYSTGQPELSVARITIPPRQALPMHYHPYATAGVLLSGQLVVHSATGESRILSAGDGLIELVNQEHAGANPGDEPAVILVVYAGIAGEPVTVLAKECPDGDCQ